MSIDAEPDWMKPPAADGRLPVKVYFDFSDRRWSAATYRRPGARDVYDVEVFTRTNWNEWGAYSRGEHVGMVIRVDDHTWRAESNALGPIPSPVLGGGYDFPTHGNALVNILNRTKPRLPSTMLPRTGLPLVYPMPGACRWCRCHVCTRPGGRAAVGRA